MATLLGPPRATPAPHDVIRRIAAKAVAGAPSRRIVVVSNRVPSSGQQGCAGGLVTALRTALGRTDGLWFGWSGRVADPPAAGLAVRRDGPLSFVTADLSPADHAGYYNGFANGTLWPLFHDRPDLASFDPGHYRTYRAVNRAFARHLAPMVRPDDLVWIHDYHFLPLGRELRDAGIAAPLGFFLHTPFPGRETLSALPFDWRQGLVRGLCAYDLVGFQTRRDLRNFLDLLAGEHGIHAGPDNTIEAFGRRVRLGVFPIGIDADGFAAAAGTPSSIDEAARLRQMLDGDAILGVDRLDYTKGLPERLAAYELLLEGAPELRRLVSYVQIAAPSRAGMPEYAALGARLGQMADRINGRFGRFGWVPVRCIGMTMPRAALPALYRAARIGLVTPLRDGMNLVAKEYVAAQDPADPGVLVLSRFAGAAEGMDGALPVDPRDAAGMARALRSALDMPGEERRDRWTHLMEGLRRQSVHHWRRSFLDALEEAGCVPRAVTLAAE